MIIIMMYVNGGQQDGRKLSLATCHCTSYRVNEFLSLKPRLHDTTGCIVHTAGCHTGLTTGLSCKRGFMEQLEDVN